MLERRTLTHGRLARSYLLQSAGSNAPLVVFLHGKGGTAEWVAEETCLPQACAAAGCSVAFPEALPPDPTLAPKFLTNPQRWNDGSGRDEVPTHDDIGFLAAMMDAIGAERVVLSGFSNGATTAFWFASQYPDRLLGIVPVGGLCRLPLDAPTLPKPVRTLAIYGAVDPLIPWTGGTIRDPWGKPDPRPAIAESLGNWGRINGSAEATFDVPEPEVERWRDGDALEVYRVGGLGHHWPGGLGRLDVRYAGPASNRIDANAMLMRFFDLSRTL